MMSFRYVKINSFNMYNPMPFCGYTCGFNMYPLYCWGYNPFSIFSTAMQMMTGRPFSFWGNNSYYHNNYYNNYNYNNYNYPTFTMPQMNFGYNNLRFNSLYTTPYYAKDYSKEFISQPFGTVTSPYVNRTYNEEVYTPYKNTSSYNSSTYKPTYKPTYTTLNASHLNKEFLDKVKQIAKNINCDYEDLLAVMNSESGLDPAITHKNRNGKKTAVGLIQFTESGAIAELNKTYGMNLTIDKIEKMSAMEQLDLVEKYYKVATKKFGGKKLTAADLYATTYVPGFATRDILTRRGDGYYEGNEGLDENGDGVISKSDLERHLAKKRVNLDTFS